MPRKPTATRPATRFSVPGFAAALRSHREAAGLTQQQVDDRVGLATGTTHQIETGRRDPSFRLALLLSGAVEMSLDDFRKKCTIS